MIEKKALLEGQDERKLDLEVLVALNIVWSKVSGGVGALQRCSYVP